MTFQFGIGQRRFVVKALLVIFGLGVLPYTGEIIQKLLGFSLGGFATVGQVFGVLALVFAYLVHSGKA